LSEQQRHLQSNDHGQSRKVNATVVAVAVTGRPGFAGWIPWVLPRAGTLHAFGVVHIAKLEHSRQSPLNMKNSFPSGSSLSRRHFLALSGAIPAVIATGTTASNSAAEETTTQGAGMKRHRIGLELYSVRGELQRDLSNTLSTVAKIGYEVVEFYSPYFKWTPAYAKEVRAQLDDLGLRCYSTHNGFESFSSQENMAHAIELNQILGARYIVLASAPGNTNGVDGWKKLCEQLTSAVEQLKQHGLSAGYHNHQAEWAKLENGQRILEVIAGNTPKEFVLQLDVGTCEEAGEDPVAWVKTNPGRIKTMHLKDWAPAGNGDKQGYRVLFSEGVTPWKELLAAAESVGGLEYFLIEQEGRFSEFETVKRCLDNWKAMFGKA
jgi:sugar phosphate isomerase/epimerase